MFEKLYAEDSVECSFQVRVGEFESCNVACDDFEVLKFLLLSLGTSERRALVVMLLGQY